MTDRIDDLPPGKVLMPEVIDETDESILTPEEITLITNNPNGPDPERFVREYPSTDPQGRSLKFWSFCENDEEHFSGFKNAADKRISRVYEGHG